MVTLSRILFMQPNLDYHDPLSTATAAIQLSSALARSIRNDLYPLLGQRTPGGLSVISTRMQNDPFSQFVSNALDHLLADIEEAIQRHTTTSVEYYVARSFGGEDEIDAREVLVMDETARELDQFRQQLSRLINLIARTEALLAARRHIGSAIGSR
jgi:hypothetical protein